MRGGSAGSGRGNMFGILDLSEEASGLQGLARREVKYRCNLDPHRELVGMRQAVPNFGQYNLFLGSDLYDCSRFQRLRHQQFHSVLRDIQKVPLDLGP